MNVYINRCTKTVDTDGVSSLCIKVNDNFNPTKILENKSYIEEEGSIIESISNKTITFSDDPTAFTVEDIINAKYQSLLDSSSLDYIIADIFLNEEDIDFDYSEHSANTGVAIMQLLPNGKAKTKNIMLEEPVDTFKLLEFDSDGGVDIYINDVKLTDNVITLTEKTDKISIKFVNTTDKLVDVKSYAIAY